MLQTVEALIDRQGQIRLIEPATLPVGRRVLITILSEQIVKRTAPLHESEPVAGQTPVKGDSVKLVKFFRQSPLYGIDLDLTRDKEFAREVVL
jgi:hypothetical protein